MNIDQSQINFRADLKNPIPIGYNHIDSLDKEHHA